MVEIIPFRRCTYLLIEDECKVTCDEVLRNSSLDDVDIEGEISSCVQF